MPDFPYRCQACGYSGDFAFRVGEAPKDLSCPICKRGIMRRTYTPIMDLWKNQQGEIVRGPGRQWAGSETFNPEEFRAKNRVNTGRGKAAK